MGRQWIPGGLVMAAAVAVALGFGRSASPGEDTTGNEPAPKAPALGQRAPEFTLTDATGHKRALSDFRGKKAVALVFYPAMFREGG